MAKASKLDRLSDQVTMALLEKHACPLSFHAVRALFMGNIATPDMAASPMQTIHDLWGGELPEFESKKDAELLMMGLMQGLWNGLSAHQNPSTPLSSHANAHVRICLRPIRLKSRCCIDGL